MADILMGQQNHVIMMPSPASALSPGQRLHRVFDGSDEKVLDTDNNSTTTSSAEFQDDSIAEEETPPIYKVSVITVDQFAPDIPHGELSRPTHGSSGGYFGGGKGHQKGRTISAGFSADGSANGTSAATAAVSAVGMMCSHVAPPIDVGAGACGAMNPLVRSPLHDDVPYQHLAAAAALRDLDNETYPSPSFQYSPETVADHAKQKMQQQWQNSCSRAAQRSTWDPASVSKPSGIRVRSSSITFTTGPSRLSALGRSNRAPKVERFNYAKALLRSDDELEKLAAKIRSEINESELFELALAAEKAAEAGEDRFTGRASTFGTKEQHSTPIVSTYPQAIPPNTNSKAEPSKAPATPPQSKLVKPPSVNATTRATTESIPKTPMATPIPKTPLKMDVGSSASKRFPTAGPGGSTIRPTLVAERSISEPQLSTLALLDGAIVVTPSHRRQQPEKRSMGVHSLRDVSEVIPHFKELHAHMRTHLYREKVDKQSLFFHEGQPPTPQGWGRFQNRLSCPRNDGTIAGGNGTESDRVANNSNASPQHRRSRSFFANIAEMRLPRFGQQKRLQEGMCSSRSFDDKFVDDAMQSSTWETSPISAPRQLQIFGKTLSSHFSPTKKQCGERQEQPKLRGPQVRVPKEIGNPGGTENTSSGGNVRKEKQDVPISTAAVDVRRRLFHIADEIEPPTSLTALPRPPEPFDLKEFQVATTAETSLPPRNRSACSSETTSVVSTYDDDDAENVPIGYSDNFPAMTELHSQTSLASSPLSTNSKKLVLSSVMDEGGMPSVSLIDDGSTCPTSPLHESTLETFMYQSYPPLDEAAPATAPLTPKSTAPRADSEFNTPAHLRVIKRLHRKFSPITEEAHGGRKEQEQQHLLQPRLKSRDQEHPDQPLIATPATKFGAPLEPNSIVDHSFRAPSCDYVHERAKVPSLHDAETSFLALPTINSSTSDLASDQVSQKFVRRTLRRQWSGGSNLSLESPTTPTKPPPARLLRSMKERDILVLKPALSCHEGPVPGSDESTITENYSSTYHKNESSNHLGRFSSDLELRSDVEPVRDLPVCLFPRSEECLGTTSAAFAENEALMEEKKECDGCIAFSGQQQAHSASMSGTPLSLSKELHERQSFHVDYGCSRHSLHVDSQTRNSIHSKESQNTENENTAGPMPTRNDTTTSSGSAIDSDGISPLLKPSAETWEERFVADLDVLPMVNSIVTMASSNVNDASAFLADMTSDSHDFVADSYDSCASVGRNLIGSPGHRSLCHSLPSTDENFKAAVQGVLSHLTLSPRRQQLQSGVFLPELENKEFLTNYFYCTKRETHQDHDVDQDASAAVGGEGGLSCAEPCNGQDTQCYLIGVDAVCGGFTYLFPTTTNVGSVDGGSISGGLNYTNSEGFHSAPDRSASCGKENQVHQPQFLPQPHAGIDWQHQQQQDKSNWVGMFQRAVSQRFKFQFQSENELEKSRHPFNPPCLSRRVAPPHESR